MKETFFFFTDARKHKARKLDMITLSLKSCTAVIHDMITRDPISVHDMIIV